jgi:hypothetical protein
LLLFGALGLGLLIVAIGVIFWLRSSSSPPAEAVRPAQPPAATQTSTPPPIKQVEPPSQIPQASSLHGQYLAKAKGYLGEGRHQDACDYLKDIPSTSPLRAEALELAKQIPGCTL